MPGGLGALSDIRRLMLMLQCGPLNRPFAASARLTSE
jgi:hypothetical protein